MTTTAQLHLEAKIVLLVAAFSCMGSLFILATIHMYTAVFKRRFPVLTSLLWQMSICDVLFSAVLIAEFLPPVLHMTHNYHPAFAGHKNLCRFMAVMIQFCQLASFGWYAMVAWHSWRILRAVDKMAWKSMARHAGWEHALVWSLSGFLALLPLAGDAYGPELDSGKNECWIPGRQSWYRLTFYMPLSLSLVFAMALLVYAIRVAHRHRHMLSVAGSQSRLVIRMASFVGVFVVCWTLPLIDRTQELVTGHESPFWLQLCHGICGASFGFGNFLCWVFSNPYQSVACTKCRRNTRYMAEDERGVPSAAAQQGPFSEQPHRHAETDTEELLLARPLSSGLYSDGSLQYHGDARSESEVLLRPTPVPPLDHGSGLVDQDDAVW